MTTTAASDRLLSVEEARAAVLGAIEGPLPDTEDVDLTEALGRVVAVAPRATTDLPPWDNSAMDGYAVRAADTALASEDEPVRLRVIGEVAAGEAPVLSVGPGSAIRIATGAPIPPGADAVVAIELTTPLDAAGNPGRRERSATAPIPTATLVHERVSVGSSIRERGSDLRAGDLLIADGVAITPASVALVAGAGVARVTVHRTPRVAVLATGDEIRAAGEPLGPAGIPDANGPGLLALVSEAGAEAIDLGRARDDLDEVVGRLQGALGQADIVVVAGGVSVGPYDVVRAAFERIGRIDIWRVAVQPGKPFAFGVAARGRGRPALLFGLPGNPVSGFVTFELFVRPAIRRLAGRTSLLRPSDRAILLDAARTSHGRRAFLRVIARRDPNGWPIRDEKGRVSVRLAGGQGSHVLSALAAADALAVIPEAVDEVVPGTEVDLLWLDRD
jgi:molybdopterin molybdotransferase